MSERSQTLLQWRCCILSIDSVILRRHDQIALLSDQERGGDAPRESAVVLVRHEFAVGVDLRDVVYDLFRKLDESEAKDVVQDVFAKLWDGTNPLKEETLRTFLLTCVRNRCLNIIAQRKTEQKALLLLTPGAIDNGNHDEELIQAIEHYIDERLTTQTSRIIRMHFDEEQSYKEISSSLGISLSAVNKHIVQGLRKLRSTFKNREA